MAEMGKLLFFCEHKSFFVVGYIFYLPHVHVCGVFISSNLKAKRRENELNISNVANR